MSEKTDSKAIDPQFHSIQLEESKNQGEAQHLELVIKYKRTFITENEDGEQELDEEETFTGVEPGRIKEFKSFIISNFGKNDDTNKLEVQLNVDYLIQMFNVIMPDLKILKLFYHNQQKGKVFTEANLNKLPQLFIKLTAIKSQLEEESSLISQSDINPEEERYQLILNIKLTVIAKLIDQYEGQNDYDGKSVISNTSNELITPNWQNKSNNDQIGTNFDLEQTDTSIPLNQNYSDGCQDYHDFSDKEVSFAENNQQISLEDRILRIEKLWVSFASTINSTFANHGNLLESLNLQRAQSTPIDQQHKNNKSSLKSPQNIDLNQNQDNFGQLGNLSSPDTLIEGVDTNNPKVQRLQQIPSSQSKHLIKFKQGNHSDQNLLHSLALKPQISASEFEGPNDLFLAHPVPSTLKHWNTVNYDNLEKEQILYQQNPHNLEIILEQDEPQTDLIYLSSNPLVLKNENGDKVENQKLRIHQEKEEICQTVKSTKKQFNFKSLIGTSVNLQEVLNEGTKILHISSHGKQIKKHEQSSTLLFEPTDRDENFEQGEGCDLKLEDISDALKTSLKRQGREDISDALKTSLKRQGSHINIKMIFVSACHSESVGRIFKENGIPIVIAVNQFTTIYDEVCIVFSKYLYKNLLQGKTPIEAFHLAEGQVRQQKMGLSLCCCQHLHEKDCLFEIIEQKTKTKIKKHILHELEYEKCNCKDMEFRRNIQSSIRYLMHKKGCPYIDIHYEKMEYYNKFYNSSNEQFTKDLDEKLKQDFFNSCCCPTKDKPHDEFSKFKFITVEDVKDQISPENYQAYKKREQEQMNKPIFPIPREGPFNWELGDYSKIDHLNKRIQEYKLIGRAKRVQQIVNKIAKMESDNRLIHVHGEDGNGKSDITNYAARYALEGRVELHAAYYINIESITTQEGLKQKIIEEIVYKHSFFEKALSQNDDVDKIFQNKLLIIFDKCQSFINNDRERFSNVLLELLEQMIKTIIIVISDSEKDLNQQVLGQYQSVHIKQLSLRKAFKLFMNSIQDLNIVKNFKKEIQILKSDYKYEPFEEKFFKDYNRKTDIIFQYAQMVNSEKKSFKTWMEELSKMREEHEQLLIKQKEKGIDCAEEILTLLNPVFKIYPIKYNKNMYALLFLLSMSNGGLFKTDLDKLFQYSQSGLGWEPFMRFLSDTDSINYVQHNIPLENEIGINTKFLFDDEQIKSDQEKAEQNLLYQPIQNQLSKEISPIQNSDLLNIENLKLIKDILFIPQRHIKRTMMHQMENLGFKLLEICQIYEYFLSFMINFAEKALNMQRITANYSLEELNIVIDSPFLLPSFDIKQEKKHLPTHLYCSDQCLKLHDQELDEKDQQNLMLKKLYRYESNPKSILDKEFLKTYYFGSSFKQTEIQERQPLPEEKIIKMSYIYLTLLITEERFESADSLLQNCIEVAEYFKLQQFLAKLYLIQINLNLMKQNYKARENMNVIEQLDKVKMIWVNELRKINKQNNDLEEEKNEGDQIKFLLQNYQDKNSSFYHDIKVGQVLSVYLRIKYETKCKIKDNKEVQLKEFESIMRTLDDQIQIVSQNEVLINHQMQKDFCKKVLISKLQLMQLEIMKYNLRESINDKVHANSQMIEEKFDKIDIKFLNQQGFIRLTAIYYRLKGYFIQWIAKKQIQDSRHSIKAEALTNFRLSNKFLTIALKQFKKVDLQDRGQEIEKKIEYNFNMLDKDQYRKISGKNLICCLYSLPLVISNESKYNENDEQDPYRFVYLKQMWLNLKKKERIFDEIQSLPLNQTSLEMIKSYRQCSIVHIISKIDLNKNLILEDNNGIGIQKSQEEISQILSQPENLNHIKLVVLDFPQSYSFGQHVFFNHGVENVISFDQSAQSFDNEESNQIKIFFSQFYERLFSTFDPVTVTEAFHYSVQQLKLNNKSFNQTIIPQLTTKTQIDGSFNLLFEKAPQRKIEENKNLEENQHYQNHPHASRKINAIKIIGRNVKIQQVVEFINHRNFQSNQKQDRILRIVGNKFVGKRSIVEQARNYIEFRDSIKIGWRNIEIKSSQNKDQFISEFEKMLTSMNQSQFKGHKEIHVNIIVVFDFSDLKQDQIGKSPVSKKTGKKNAQVSSNNELGEYFDHQCEINRNLKIILLMSQINHDLMSSSSRLITIDPKQSV